MIDTATKGTLRMRRFLISLTFGLLTACVPLGCAVESNPGETESIDDIGKLGNKAQMKEITSANGDFAIDLYRQLAKQPEYRDKNLFFSPYSIFCALAMTAEGARGETAAQMGSVLHFPETARHIGGDAKSIPWNTSMIHVGVAALDERFMSDTAKKQYALRVANALWIEKTYPIQQSYADTIQRFYRGGVFPVDFIDRSESERQKINAWIEEQTNKHIKDMIPPRGVNENTRLVLTNAIYFKGDWLESFVENRTKEDRFTTTAGKDMRVAMMLGPGMRAVRYGAFQADGSFFKTPATVSRKSTQSLYPDKDGFLMIELPYKGGDLSMVVILPQDIGGLDRLEKSLSNANFQSWCGKLEKRPVHVYLPKFKLKTDYGLSRALVSLGMTRAFVDPTRPNGAQFDGMCTSQNPRQKFSITDVLHKAFVEVNEKGTEAAAATVVAHAVPVSVRPTEPFTPTFRANKPFVFIIRDVKTGIILFLGRMTNPTE
jgi:serine protease inhibitor